LLIRGRQRAERQTRLKSLAAGLKEREIEDVLLDPEDASVEAYLKLLGLGTKRELLNYVRAHYSEQRAG
jgi:hypothetical protein